MRHALVTLSVLVLFAASVLAGGHNRISQSIGFVPVGQYDPCSVGVAQTVVQQQFIPHQSFVVRSRVPAGFQQAPVVIRQFTPMVMRQNPGVVQKIPIYTQALGSNVLGYGGIDQQAFLSSNALVDRGFGFAPGFGGGRTVQTRNPF